MGKGARRAGEGTFSSAVAELEPEDPPRDSDSRPAVHLVDVVQGLSEGPFLASFQVKDANHPERLFPGITPGRLVGREWQCRANPGGGEKGGVALIAATCERGPHSCVILQLWVTGSWGLPTNGGVSHPPIRFPGVETVNRARV